MSRITGEPQPNGVAVTEVPARSVACGGARAGARHPAVGAGLRGLARHRYVAAVEREATSEIEEAVAFAEAPRWPIQIQW
jgi:hypothetical protein